MNVWEYFSPPSSRFSPLFLTHTCRDTLEDVLKLEMKNRDCGISGPLPVQGSQED